MLNTSCDSRNCMTKMPMSVINHKLPSISHSPSSVTRYPVPPHQQRLYTKGISIKCFRAAHQTYQTFLLTTPTNLKHIGPGLHHVKNIPSPDQPNSSRCLLPLQSFSRFALPDLPSRKTPRPPRSNRWRTLSSSASTTTATWPSESLSPARTCLNRHAAGATVVSARWYCSVGT